MNFLLISKPGWGKTTAACTGRHPTLLIDVDQKAEQMHNLRPLIDDGSVTVRRIKAKLVSDRLSERALNPDKAPAVQPLGYVETVDLLNDIIDNLGGFEKYNTIVLDSLTRLVEHMKRLLIYHRGKGKFGKHKPGKTEGDMNWPSWGSYLSNLEELFDATSRYMEKDFICTAHVKEIVEKDPMTEVEFTKGVWPLVDGQMRDKLAGYFNEVYFLDAVFSKTQPTIYRFRTRGKKYCARTSLPLDEFENANIVEILNKSEMS